MLGAGRYSWDLPKAKAAVILAFERHQPLARFSLNLSSKDVLAGVSMTLSETTGPTTAERAVGTPEERW